MSTFPYLLAMIAVPAVGAAVVAALPKGREETAKQATLGVSLLVLLLAVLATVAFDVGGERFQLTTSVAWIPDFGVDFALGVDGIALVMLLLIGVLVPVVIGASWRETATGERSMRTFFAWLLLLESMMVGVFAATDVFLFYVFFEAMLVPMYFLIGSFGGPRRQYAAVKFFLYSLLGGLIMLASVIGLYVVSGTRLDQATFSWTELQSIAATVPESTQIWLFLGFFAAFAIKAPLVPLHTWLPDAGAEAPVGAGVLLVGVLDKVGTFGFLRYCLPLFPDASRDLAPYIIVLCVIGILYGALLAMGQKDLKRLVSYTSVAHFGFIGLGIFAFTSQAQTGAVLYMVNHGLSTGALFLVVGFLIARGRSRLVGDYSGVAALAPILAGTFLVAGLSSLALPGLSTFVSEFLVLIGTFVTHRWWAVVATSGVILAAIYLLWAYQRVFHGRPEGANATFPEMTMRERVIMAPLVVLIIFLGVYPKPVLDRIGPSVDALVTHVERHSDYREPARAAEPQEFGREEGH